MKGALCCPQRPVVFVHRTKHRWICIVLSGVVLLLCFSGCTGPLPSSSPDLNGKLSAVGSTALQPLVAAAASLFQKHHPSVHISVHGGGSFFGLDAVTNQQAEIGDSDVYADRAIYPDPNLTDHLVCVSIYTMIVGPGVTVSSLTHQQLIDIFSTGNIHDWSEVGGKPLPIIPVVLPLTSGTRATFRKYVLGGQDETGNSTGTLIQVTSEDAVRETVARTPGAIGYLALSALGAGITPLSIDGQTASLAHIEQRQYPFWSYEHMYTLDDSAPTLSAFLNFMLTPDVQNLARHLNYIPLAEMKLSLGGPSMAKERSRALTSALFSEREETSRE